MADKTLGMLVPATDIFPTDLFLVEQSGVAKNVPGQVMINFLVRVADGHGGVSDFQKLSESGLEKTYQFLMADGTKYQFTVTDGNSIADFQDSVSGLVHTCKFIMDDGTEYNFKVSDGEKGDKGDNAYVHIRFASQKPTSSSSSMGTEPDAWMGIYSGNKASAPTDPMEYTWVRVLGNQGRTGDPATVTTNKTEYQVSTSGTIIPSGVWSTTIPPVPNGQYLWARTTLQFNTGEANYIYSISRYGIDGEGATSTVNNVAPDEYGNVQLDAEDVGALPSSGGVMTGPISMNGQSLTGLNDPIGDTDALRLAYLKSKYLSIDQMYPVGAVYISTVATSPASLFGGEWEQIQGKFLLGADATHANGSTGGAETVALTTDNLPSHQHGLGNGWSFNWSVGGSGTYIAAEIVGGTWEGNKPYPASGTSDATGSGTKHNNMPPYLAVYIWKRVK